jgi:hypothetical protein
MELRAGSPFFLQASHLDLQDQSSQPAHGVSTQYRDEPSSTVQRTPLPDTSSFPNRSFSFPPFLQPWP